MNRDWRAGDDAYGLATELEQRALTHEKVLDHLDLRAARSLRALARRIRDVADKVERGEGDAQAHHVELMKLRLEAMSALLTELVATPRATPPRSSNTVRADTRAEDGDVSLAALVARRRAAGDR